MDDRLAININVNINYGYERFIPLDIVQKTLNAIDGAVHTSEMRDFKHLKKILLENEIPLITLQAVETRLREHRKKSIIKVGAINHGSLEVAVVLGGLCIWTLQQTLGETLKQAWLESGLHKKIKEILLRSRCKKAKLLRDLCIKNIENKLNEQTEVRVEFEDYFYKDIPTLPLDMKIKIIVSPKEDYPPEQQDLFDQD
jgi:hypothetical protein